MMQDIDGGHGSQLAQEFVVDACAGRRVLIGPAVLASGRRLELMSLAREVGGVIVGHGETVCCRVSRKSRMVIGKSDSA